MVDTARGPGFQLDAAEQPQVTQVSNYLLGRRFNLRTDHNILLWLMGFKKIECQLARWIEELTVYNMEIVHQHGKDHVNADGLSRIPDQLEQYNYYSYGCDVHAGLAMR